MRKVSYVLDSSKVLKLFDMVAKTIVTFHFIKIEIAWYCAEVGA